MARGGGGVRGVETVWSALSAVIWTGSSLCTATVAAIGLASEGEIEIVGGSGGVTAGTWSSDSVVVGSTVVVVVGSVSALSSSAQAAARSETARAAAMYLERRDTPPFYRTNGATRSKPSAAAAGIW